MKSTTRMLAGLCLGLGLSGAAMAAQVIFEITVLRQGEPTNATGALEVWDVAGSSLVHHQGFQVFSPTSTAHIELSLSPTSYMYIARARDTDERSCSGQTSDFFVAAGSSATIIATTIDMTCQ